MADVFLGVGIESLLGEEEVRSGETSVTPSNHNVMKFPNISLPMSSIG